tara:strand:+ start:6369 stop:6551 length:183 start_codon:yes stop_codon:yes gene_type:complete
MSKDLKKVNEVVESVINNQEKQALNILIQSVKLANNKGAFELDDAIVIGQSKNILEYLTK